jgi:cobalt-zinc-cadmium efflux system membrane fusion protein
MKLFIYLLKCRSLLGVGIVCAAGFYVHVFAAPLAVAAAAAPEPAVELADTQLASIKIEPVEEHAFPQERQAVGDIDFNQELLTQVFTQYQGRIIKAFASVGDTVKKNQTLFTIESPDLLQAESTLISAAGVLDLTTRNLERQHNLVRQSAAAQKDYEQAISDQQAAEGAYRAARGAVKVFDKTDAEIDRIVAERKVDATLTIPSPITGLVTTRNAAPGLLVQPGNPPPVYIVADTSTMWMIANVPEREAADLKAGQEVAARVSSFPGRIYKGKIVIIGPNVDPNTRRVFVRSEIADPNYDLRAGMFATFVITVAPPKIAPAVPQDAVVREGDGTMTVWTTTDRHKFVKREIKIGLASGGFTEVLEGLQVGELVATDGSIFIANQYSNAGN